MILKSDRFVIVYYLYLNIFCLNIFVLSFQGTVATAITQPLDVLKTRAMNAKPGEFKGPLHLIAVTARQGFPFAFFKGFVPAFVRLGPHTIITFVLLEQLRLRFGELPISAN